MRPAWDLVFARLREWEGETTITGNGQIAGIQVADYHKHQYGKWYILHDDGKISGASPGYL